MGEYPEWSDRIQGGFALRAWLLLDQYLRGITELRDDEQYEATLTVCVLQALLTNTVEFLKDPPPAASTRVFDQALTDAPNEWGLSQSIVADNSFPVPLTMGALVVHLRDAVSHPTFSKSQYPVTGYTTRKHPSGKVSTFVLTSSPWIKDGVLMEAYEPSSEKAAAKIIRQFEKKNGSGPLQPLELPNGRFVVGLVGERYLPFVVVELSLQQLIGLAKQLATYLVQQAVKDEAGRPIEELAALDPHKKRLLYVV